MFYQSNEKQLSGRRVVITGASRSIGKAIAAALASRGATLFLSARNEER